MRRLFLTGLLLFGLVAAATLARQARAESLTSPVKVGLSATLFPGLPERILRAAAAPFKTLLEGQTGVKGQIVAGGQPMTLAGKVNAGSVQLGVFQGIEFARARHKYPTLQPLVMCSKGQSQLQVYLIVLTSTKAAALDDLAGKALAMPGDSKEHSNLFLAHRCAPAGKTPEKHYSKVMKVADAEDALDALIDGDVDAAVIDNVAWELYKQHKPGCAKSMKVLVKSEIFPCAVIAYKPGTLDKSQVASFRAGLIAAKKSAKGKEMLRFLGLTGFEEVPATYERLFTDINKAYPAK